MDQALLYVSKSLVTAADAERDVGDIIEVALARNAKLGVTGALIYTTSEFAQFLEGPEDALAELMASIRRDKRHTDVTVVYQQPIQARRFPRWAMAYSGRASFVSGHVRPLLNSRDAATSDAVTRLIRLMEAFVKAE